MSYVSLESQEGESFYLHILLIYVNVFSSNRLLDSPSIQLSPLDLSTWMSWKGLFSTWQLPTPSFSPNLTVPPHVYSKV